MVRLPPPPRFTIPPPPMLPTDLFGANNFAQLTCSSIQQSIQPTWTMTRFLLFTSASCLVAVLLFTITFIWLLAIRKQKQFHIKQHVKSSSTQPPVKINTINDWSTDSNRSYETISTDHTGEYVESVDTSATMCSIETDSIVCIESQRQQYHPMMPYYHVLNIPDLVPN